MIVKFPKRIVSPLASLPDDSALPFIQQESAWQGSVTSDGFMVVSRLASLGVSRLVVYSDSARTQVVSWTPLLSTNSDRVCRYPVIGLSANTKYYWSVNSGNQKGQHSGEIRTLPVGAASFKFIASACSGNGLTNSVSNHIVFSHIANAHPDALMFLHLGDLHYKDISVNDVSQFRTGYQHVLAQSRQHNLYRKIPIAYSWSDHDFGPNNSNSSSAAKPAAMQAYKEYVPHYPLSFAGATEPITQTYVVGRVRFIVLDTRSAKVQGTTMLGDMQKQWLKDTLLAASEPLICITSDCPWIGDGSGSDGSDHWGGHQAERAELMSFFADNNLTNRLFIIAGDAHMIAIDDGTNNAGIPVFQNAALDCPGSLKGGPYSEGSFQGGGQFSTYQLQDTGGNSISLSVTGYRVSADGNTITTLISYTHEFTLSGDATILPLTYSENAEEFTGPYPSWKSAADYGAVGDDLTDDTAALQAWLNAASATGDVLYLPSGTYRISATLLSSAKINLAVIGESPDTTIIKWHGDPNGTMISLNGVAYSKYGRITWDGRGVSGVSAYKHAWDGSTGYASTFNEHFDEVFKDANFGIRGGTAGYMDAETAVLRCKFLRCAYAGVSVENYNALDWQIWDCYFEQCGRGVTNKMGAGNFNVFHSIFYGSTYADIHTANTQFFCFRNNYSLNSASFYYAEESYDNGGPVTLQENTILDSFFQLSVYIGSAGPTTFIGNTIRSRAEFTSGTSVYIRAEQIRSGNKVTIANTIEKPQGGTLLNDTNDDTQLVSRASIIDTIPTLQATPVKYA